jgi:carboxylesterase type B
MLDAEQKKRKLDDRFLIEINKKPVPLAPMVPILMKKAFDMKQKRRKESPLVIQTNTQNYQIFNQCKREFEEQEDCATTTAAGRSLHQKSATKASLFLESCLVACRYSGS